MLFVYFLVGLYLLIKGADLLTDGTASLAAKYNLNQVVIGLTVVAFGTSAPELFVTLSAIFKNSNQILLGNLFGSSILNVFLILGCSSILGIINVHKRLIKLELPFTLMVCFLLLIGVNDNFFNSGLVNQISMSDGLVLLGLFIYFIWSLFSYKQGFFEEKPNFVEYSNLKTYSYVFLGILFLLLGSFQVVDSGIQISEMFGLNQTIVGALFISLGTSLPEIVTSFTAFKKKNNELMIGNIVGSNIFNLLFILGLAALFQPVNYTQDLNLHLYTMIFAQFILLLTLFVSKEKILSRMTGFIFVALYFLYLFLNFI